MPPGQSRVVRVPRPESDAQKPFRLILKGDGSPFDNAVTAAPPRQRQLSVVYFGSDSPTDPDGLRYYLERAFPATPGRQVSILAQEPDAPLLLPENRDARLAVVTGAVSEDHLNGLRSFTRNGGTLLFVMTDPSQAAMLNALLETDGVRADEAEIRDYAMFSEIDFSHPLFAPFAEPEFADFTKIHVWRHRSLTLDGRDGVRIPARFDDGDPAVVEFAEGDGRVVILTTGWHPPDSQLALSSKFVPLMNGLLDLNGDGVERRARYIVGDPVPVPRPKSAEFPPRVRLPDDREIELASGQSRFEETVVPGLYTVTAPEDDGPSQFTVHLAADESRTAPLPVETLERHGVRLNRVDDGDGQSVSEESSRQLQARELEDRQQFWRWLIGTAVVVLLAETWLAGRLTHRPSSRTP